MHCLCKDKLYLATSKKDSEGFDISFARILFLKDLVSNSFLDQLASFGLKHLQEFIQEFHDELERLPSGKTLCHVEDGEDHQEWASGIFFIGCYVIMMLKRSADDVWDSMHTLQPTLQLRIESDGDESESEHSLLELWKGFERAANYGWVTQMTNACTLNKSWQGYIQNVIPGELVVIRSPKEHRECSNWRRRRYVTPHFYLAKFQAAKICTLVRLNEREYADESFEQHNIACVSCEFDTPTPSPGAVTAFLHTVRTARATVAVHCDGAQGRSGTLVALHMMRAHGFRAREATAWLRIACPAMRLGPEQLDFLRSVDAVAHRPSVAPRRGSAALRQGVYAAWAARSGRALAFSDRLRHQSAYAPALAPPRIVAVAAAKDGYDGWEGASAAACGEECPAKVDPAGLAAARFCALALACGTLAARAAAAAAAAHGGGGCVAGSGGSVPAQFFMA
jgi:protein-tyrosine phosphatase